MQVGVVYPQTEYSCDPAAIKDYTQTIEGLGFQYVLAYDHILGANPERPGGWTGPYNFHDPFMEPFVLFSFMAGITQKLGFATGIVILPQRQIALVAKQAAVLDHLCGGRLRLGVGIGWNEVEYVALGENFNDRGKRIEEQIQVMRSLWTQKLVTFEGKWHKIEDAGINPLPLQRPIPVWMGGQAKAVLRRAAHLADGWMPTSRTVESAQPYLDVLYEALVQAGKEPGGYGIEARVHYGNGSLQELVKIVDGWQTTASHLSVNTMGCGFTRPEQHLEALSRVAIEIGLRNT